VKKLSIFQRVLRWNTNHAPLQVGSINGLGGLARGALPVEQKTNPKSASGMVVNVLVMMNSGGSMSGRWKNPFLKESPEVRPLILQALEILNTASSASFDVSFRYEIEGAICRLLDLVSKFDVEGWPKQ